MTNDPLGLIASGIPPEIAAQMRGLTREQAVAEALMAQSQKPLETNRTAGGYVVPISPFEGIAKLAQGYLGRKGADAADKRMADLGGQYQNVMADEIKKYMQMKQGTPATTVAPLTPNDDEGNVNPSLDVPAVAADPRAAVTAAMTSRNPILQKLGQMDYQVMAKRDEPYTLAPGAQRIGTDGKVVASAPFKPDTPRPTSNLQRLITERDALPPGSPLRVTYDNAIRKESETAKQISPTVVNNNPQPVTPVTIIRDGKTVVVDGRTGALIGDAPKNKTGGILPPTAVKIQNELLDEIGTSGGINSDLGALGKQIDSGALKLGLVTNLASQAKNFVGSSDEASRNFASFRATLEKLRNDSLRLNKGVQTEGDAIRAWKELISNVNDPAVVRQRIAEIQRINQRGADLKQMQLDQLRGNYGIEPLDTAPAFARPPAVGQGGAPASGASGGWGIQRVD